MIIIWLVFHCSLSDRMSTLISRTEVVKWLTTLHSIPYEARQAVGEPWSDQSAGHIKPMHLDDCLDSIQIALVVNK